MAISWEFQWEIRDFPGIDGDFMGVSMGKWMNMMISWELIGENM